jgi:hypothetical protein
MSSGMATVAATAGTTVPESFSAVPSAISTPKAIKPCRRTGERS